MKAPKSRNAAGVRHDAKLAANQLDVCGSQRHDPFMLSPIKTLARHASPFPSRPLSLSSVPLLLSLALAFVLGASSVVVRAADDASVSSDDKAFFAELKKAVLAHEAAWVGAHVAFPLHVRVDEQPLSMRTSEEFVQNYDRIMTVEMVNTVRKQTAEYLFKNTRGVMIGDGEIWFARQPDDAELDHGKPRYLIIAIEASSRPHGPSAGAATSKGGG
jgi:hypothetical protein